MRILLVYTVEEKDTATRLVSLLAKPEIDINTLMFKSDEDKDVKRFVDSFTLSGEEEKEKMTVNPSHAIVLSPLSTRLFDFLAGFSCGSRVHLLVFGQEAITGISEEFAFCFTFLQNEEALIAFFDAEYQVFKKLEAAREVIRAQETLLRMGVPITAESLAHCAREGSIREVSLFLAAGFSPDTRNKAGVPLLSIAARNGNHEVVRFLVHAGAQVNLQADDRGTSALMDSVMGKHFDVLTDLIKAGADLNIKSKDGQTALVVAVGAGDENYTEALLKAGADPDISDSLGTSARKYALLFHKESIVSLFNTYAPPKAT